MYFSVLNIKSIAQRHINIVNKEYDSILDKMKNALKEISPNDNIEGLKDEEIIENFIKLDRDKNFPVEITVPENQQSPKSPEESKSPQPPPVK